MNINDIIENKEFTVVNDNGNTENIISKVFCCDILSIAMSKAPEKCAWITVSANVNTLAVGVYRNVSCIIIAEGIEADKTFCDKACERGIIVLKSDKPVFECAIKIDNMLKSQL